MTTRERQLLPGEREDIVPEGDKPEAPATGRDALVKYLRYVLPEVAAINPTSALLIDQAISGLIGEPGSNADPLAPPKYS